MYKKLSDVMTDEVGNAVEIGLIFSSSLFIRGIGYRR